MKDAKKISDILLQVTPPLQKKKTGHFQKIKIDANGEEIGGELADFEQEEEHKKRIAEILRILKAEGK